MGKRYIYSSEKKHFWHLSHKKLERMNHLFDLIDTERAAHLKEQGRYAIMNTKERRGKL